MKKLSAEFKQEKKFWVVLEDFYNNETSCIIPKDFKFNASIPRIFFPFIDPIELSLEAACVHDYLYKHAGQAIRVYMFSDKTNKKLFYFKCFSRLEADYIFYKIMKREKVTAWKRKAAYISVRVFGYFIWRKRSNKI